VSLEYAQQVVDNIKQFTAMARRLPESGAQAA